MSRSALFLSLNLLLLSAASAQDRIQVSSLTPQGVARDVQQVRARFSEPVITFGSGDKPSPFEISCSESRHIAQGFSRWLDQNEWVFEFKDPLPSGISCELKTVPGAESYAGKEIEPQRFEFNTGGPAIRRASPYGGTIEEDQIFVLELDGGVDRASLTKAYFEVEGIASRIPAQIVRAGQARSIIQSIYRGQPKRNLILLQARQRFPSNTKLALVWDAGIRSPSGLSTQKPQRYPYATRPAFTATLSCERPSFKDQCVPISPIRIEFSETVHTSQLKEIELIGAEGKKWQPEAHRNADYTREISWHGPFPERSEFTIKVPQKIVDQSGRKLTNAASFPLRFKTGRFPALAKFAAPFGILEAKDPILPITLRNLSLQGNKEDYSSIKVKILKVEDPAEMLLWHRIVLDSDRYWWMKENPPQDTGPERRQRSVFDLRPASAKILELEIPRPNGPDAFEVAGIPLPGPGFYVVEAESRALGQYLFGKDLPMFVSSAALVTGLGVHFKWAPENSLVWVTDLQSGAPLAGAKVQVMHCSGEELISGLTDQQGLFKAKIPRANELEYCSTAEARLMVTARRGRDLSMLLSNWNFGIQNWRFNLPSDSWNPNPLIGHTILARSLLRPGDTVNMKHLLRLRSMQGLQVPDEALFPVKMRITHQGSGKKYEMPVTFDRRGSAESDWEIPQAANLGSYTITLLKKGDESEDCEEEYGCYQGDSLAALQSGVFTVAAFRVPLMSSYIKGPAEKLINPREAKLEIGARYLAGGAAADLPVKLRYGVRDTPVSFPEYADFFIANGEVKTGTTRDRGHYEEVQESTQVKTLSSVLDRFGAATLTITDLTDSPKPRAISAELEFKDPNGEIQTVSQSIPIWPAAALAGIKNLGWTALRQEFEAQAAAFTPGGKPLSGVPLKINFYSRKTYSHRKRLVGGYYSYESVTETKSLGQACSGISDRAGLIRCTIKTPYQGHLLLEAEVTDSAGKVSKAWSSVWVGERHYWYEPADHDRIDLLPERKRYEPGEIAKFQVKMPFKEGTALITAEREGVKEIFIKKLSGESPTIEIPVLDSYAPNIFISALVVRGRVSDFPPAATLDLGKPAFKLGVAQIQVGWKPYELKVSLKPEREIYKAREKARFALEVGTASGEPLPMELEVAIAAVDKGLLEIQPNNSWDLLTAMMGLRTWQAETFTAQTQVVGKRHFGLKAAPRGGGGGRLPTRELFDTLLYWNARVRPDSSGRAEFEIPLNDSLTAFKIVAVAEGGDRLFGTGEAEIRSTQDLIIQSGLAPVVREGDSIDSVFTLRNTTGRELNLSVILSSPALREPPETKSVTLAAGQSSEATWRVQVPENITSITYELSAFQGNTRLDGMKVTQKVVEPVPARIQQATLAQLKPGLEVMLEKPAGALPRKGGVNLILSPSLAGSLHGVKRYMQNYPFTCIEQKVSRAIALEDDDLWGKAMNELPNYIGSDGLLRFFPGNSCTQPGLTSYVLSIANEAGYEIPEDSKSKLLDGLQSFLKGQTQICSFLQGSGSLEKIAALHTLSRYNRAEADTAFAIDQDITLWPTSTLIEWYGLLRRLPEDSRRNEKLTHAKNTILSRLNFQGSVAGFSGGLEDLWWLMSSSDLSVLRLVAEALEGNDFDTDLPRIVRSAIERQKKGHWDLTIANAWGVLAVRKFAERFERERVSGETIATIAEESRSYDWDAPSDLLLNWPLTPSPLQVIHKGSGAPWLTVQSVAAIALKESKRAGYSISRKITPVETKTAGKFSLGDVLRVSLEVTSDADRSWVVISDPIPAGASILGAGLARESQLLRRGEEQQDYWDRPTFEERSFEWFRAYFEYLPKGTRQIDFTMRLNSSGLFNLPNSRVEAMYSPEMFGEMPNLPIEVLK